MALFTVSREVSTEAREAFFDVNTLRLRSREIVSITALFAVRHLELAGKAAFDLCHRDRWPLDTIRQFVRLLPDLRTFTVPCDELSDGGKTVRGLLTGQCAEVDIRCIEIGLFEILPVEKIHCKAYFEMPGLRKVLPKAKYLASKSPFHAVDSVNLTEYAQPYLEKGDPLVWTSIECANWLGNYEAMRAMHEGDAASLTRSLSESDRKHLRDYEEDCISTLESVPWNSKSKALLS